ACRMKQNDQNKNDRTERIQKVRSMWTLIVEILTSLKEEKEAVDSVLDVLENRVAQCILDGTNAVSSIPHLLVHRIENNVYETCTGNLYEAEKLNFLTAIQVLNEALRTLRDVNCQFELKQLHVTEERMRLSKAALQNLKAK
ncbi:HAUS6 protein, partial [Eurystomus gularis]|nr:HAUS6 protein [Eurystomus gularis]